MVIAHNISAVNTYNKMGISGKSTDKSMEKLSSGYRINKAADDAAGLSISEKMRSQIRGLNQASANAQNGISMIQTAEGALNESHSILQRMRELAVQSANDTNAATDREALQSEINQLTSEINRIGNTTEFNGMKILNGSKVTTTGRETVEVAKEITNGSFNAGKSGVKNSAKLELVNHITINALTGTGEMDYTKLQQDEGANVITISKKDGNLVVDIKLTSADGTDNTKAGADSLEVNAERLVQQVNGDWLYDNHGITFAVTKESAEKFLTNGADSDKAEIDIFKYKNPTTGDLSGVGNYDILNDYEDDSDVHGFIDKLNLTSFGDGTTRLDYDRVEIDFQNAVAGSNATLITKFYDGSDLILTDKKTFSGINASTTDKLDFKHYEGNGLEYDLNAYSGFSSSSKIHLIVDVDAKGGVETVTQNKPGSDNSVYFHVGTNTNQVINTTFSDMRAHSLGITGTGEAFTDEYTVNNGTESKNTERGLDISTRRGANLTIDIIDKAISKVSEERSKYGAIQNRLEYTINNLDTTSENMASAESTVRDTDMASEMMEMTKNQILQQASQAMLTQAMQRPQQVLQLLQG